MAQQQKASGAKGRKIGRQASRPSQKAYVSSNRSARNKALRIERHELRMLRKAQRRAAWAIRAKDRVAERMEARRLRRQMIRAEKERQRMALGERGRVGNSALAA